MATWNGWQLTEKGAALQAKIESGATKLILNCIAIGSGTYTTDETIRIRTALKSEKMRLNIESNTAQADGICKIYAKATNTNITTGFTICEMGIMAQDPDLGEILYLIATTQNGDFMPPYNENAVLTEEFNVYIAVGTNGTIKVNIDTAVYATIEHCKNTYERLDATITKAEIDAALTAAVKGGIQ